MEATYIHWLRANSQDPLDSKLTDHLGGQHFVSGWPSKTRRYQLHSNHLESLKETNWDASSCPWMLPWHQITGSNSLPRHPTSKRFCNLLLHTDYDMTQSCSRNPDRNPPLKYTGSIIWIQCNCEFHNLDYKGHVKGGPVTLFSYCRSKAQHHLSVVHLCTFDCLQAIHLPSPKLSCQQ